MTTRTRRPSRSTGNRRPGLLRRLPWRRILAVTVLLALVVGAWLFVPFWELAGQFGSHPHRQPSRLYGRMPILEPGAEQGVDDVVALLGSAGYVATRSTPTTPGYFHRDGDHLDVFRHRFPSPRGRVGGDLVRVRFAGRRVVAVERDGQELNGIWLDPPLVASFFGPELQDRRPITLDDLPEDMILSVLAAEDANFLEHIGLAPLSILRAAWVNLRAGGVVQGGSTLTQQLVKNIYLSHERRFERKVREALLSVLLEVRYEKRDILQAYLNEIYWGRSGPVDVMGIGAAAWAYFGKHPKQLTLAECATLAGMIQSPARLDPTRHPEASIERRNEVLGRLVQLQWVSRERAVAAGRAPMTAREDSLVARHAPYFTDAMADEARRRFGLEDLDDAGYVLLSTLDPSDQAEAEAAVTWGVEQLEEGWEKGREPASPLQAALVSLDPADGSIRAWVGGRDYGASQFDRVAGARRQAGSSFKPIVYAAALEARVAHPSTLLEDAPYTVELTGTSWSPRNSDGQYRGWVTARTALERSLNIPTARLAGRVGLGQVVEMANRLGIESRLQPFPALALGAMEVSPLEMATVYSTLAAGGLRSQPHGLVAVYDRQGHEVAPMAGGEIEPPRRVLGADVAYVLTGLLQGVLDRGTGKDARRQGLNDPLAGKTGTTNSRRDSWFAGYAPERTTLVWVGYDDNSSTRLSGSRAALPIWTRFMFSVRPTGGYRDFPVPDGVVSGWIDPRTGGLAHDFCSERRREVFLSDHVPSPLCQDDDPMWRRRLRSEDENEAILRWDRVLQGLRQRGDT